MLKVILRLLGFHDIHQTDVLGVGVGSRKVVIEKPTWYLFTVMSCCIGWVGSGVEETSTSHIVTRGAWGRYSLQHLQF